VILLILLRLFHHKDIILEVLLIFLDRTLYLKLPYWMRIIFCKLRYLIKLHNSITFYMIYAHFIYIYS